MRGTTVREEQQDVFWKHGRSVLKRDVDATQDVSSICSSRGRGSSSSVLAHLCQLKVVTEKQLWLKIFVLLISKCFLSLSTPFFFNQPSLLSPSRRYYVGQKQNKTNKTISICIVNMSTTIHTFTNPNPISAPH